MFLCFPLVFIHSWASACFYDIEPFTGYFCTKLDNEKGFTMMDKDVEKNNHLKLYMLWNLVLPFTY